MQNIYDEVFCIFFVELLYALNNPRVNASPQWYIDAWENYKSNPNAPAREDYAIIITLKDGTVLQEISCQPYLGNGSLNGMQKLTPEQNSILKALLK